MSQNIQFFRFNQYSPVLQLEQKLPRSFILDFLKKNQKTNPYKIMFDFISALAVSHNLKESKILDSSKVNANVEVFEIKVPDVAEFVYKKESGETNWRKIDVVEEDKYYIKGNDLNDENKFKSFKKQNIVGGRILREKAKE